MPYAVTVLSDPSGNCYAKSFYKCGHVYNKTKHRMTFEGILYPRTFVVHWRDFPEEDFGRWNTVFKRFNFMV